MQRLAIIDRGEPAMRCISAVAELNRESAGQITTIALYLRDTAAAIVREADEAMLLSPAAFAGAGRQHGTRLDPVRLLAALHQTRADALWAGWDLIADPAELARLCEREGITFVGPRSDVIRLLGDKARIRQLAESVGVAVAPWPAGPGAPPGPAARHVEVQVVADDFGTVWAVGVRDGSIRQRNQPVILESACTPLDETGEQALRDAAIRLCSAAGFRGTGSAEFGIDPVTRQFLFTDFRVQPPSGHLVTELTPDSTWPSCNWTSPVAAGYPGARHRPAGTPSRSAWRLRAQNTPSPRRQAGWSHCDRHRALGSASTSAWERATRSPPRPARSSPRWRPGGGTGVRR